MSFFPRTSAEINAAEMRRPAIIQAAKNCAYFKQQADELRKKQGREWNTLVAEFKLSDWAKEHGDWDTACEKVLGVSRRTADKAVLSFYIDVSHTGETPTTDTKNKKNNNSSQVASPSQPEPTPEPVTTPPEPPKRTATANSTPKENGKPKQSMVVWRDLHDGYGRMMNLLDKAKQVCNDPVDHAWLIATTQACMDRIEAWRAKVE